MLQSQVGHEEGSNTYKMRYNWADDETSRSRQCGKPYRTKEQEASTSRVNNSITQKAV